MAIWIRRGLIPILTAVCALSAASRLPANEATVSGVVRDRRGTPVPNAEARLLTARQAIVGTTRTDSEGRFSFSDTPEGNFLLAVTAPGFSERRIAVRTTDPSSRALDVVLEPRHPHHSVTVTADVGLADDAHLATQGINIVEQSEIEERAKSAVAQVAVEEAGVHLQKTSSTIAGVFVRGLTGNKVSVFVDGVRYSTSAQRGGINTFLGLLDASSLQSVEILRGPNSAQYGSDAIGGSLQLISRTADFSSAGTAVHGRMSYFLNTADVSLGSDWSGSFSTPRFSLLAALSGRRVNTLRPGRGLDSHAAVTRYFGLRSDILQGSRLPDTGFTQYGGLLKTSWEPAVGSQVRVSYYRGQQDGGKRSDQLLGGDGNRIADLRNLMNDLFYIRYDRLRAGPLTDFSLTYSFNAQREERANQGGNGNLRARIQRDRERTTVHGIQSHAARRWGWKHNLLFGGEYYKEGIRALSSSDDPATDTVLAVRPRVPDRSQYRSGGLYLQSVFEPLLHHLRFVGNIRYNAYSYRSRASESPQVNGGPLWPDDRLRISSATFRVGLSATPIRTVSLVANVSRGFRAPHVTDLGTLGLSGSGFEVASTDLSGREAQVGTTADRAAVSTGRKVAQVKPETSIAYEIGLRFRNRGVDSDFNIFLNDIRGIMTKHSLILPQGAIGFFLGGHRIVEQTNGGVVFVDASPTPVLVRTNLGDARIRGFEHTFDWKLNPQWTIDTTFTYVHAQEGGTGTPPNLEGGTPAPDGYFKLRYSSPGGRVWVEPYAHAAARQARLSSLDLEDRRTGAMRTRSSIRSFLLNGATARGWVDPGPDGKAGTSDDRLRGTGETLSEIQERVLGPVAEQAPLYRAVPGYFTVSLRGGFRIGEKNEVLIDLENIGDRNYRGVSWGMDAPGRSLYIRFTRSF